MRIAALLCLSFALSFALSAAECDSAIQIIEKKGQLIIKNISGKPIVGYVLTRVNSKSQHGSRTRTYSGTFGGEDSLGPGQSMEIGKADAASKELSVDYVRLGDGWPCGEATPDVRSAESSGK